MWGRALTSTSRRPAIGLTGAGRGDESALPPAGGAPRQAGEPDADRSDGPFHHPHDECRKDSRVLQRHPRLHLRPRPAFSFPGAWLYNEGKAVLHVVERPSIPEGGGVLDHIAFFGTDPSAYVAKLKERGIKSDLRRLPENGHAGGLWQLFFFDPVARGSRSTLRRARPWTGRGSCRRLGSLAIEPRLPLRAAAGSGTFLCAITPSSRSARGRIRPASARRCRSRSSPALASSRAGAMRLRWLRR